MDLEPGNQQQYEASIDQEEAMSDHARIWNAFNRPPASALKKIGGGRLKGMTDINPQWRYQAMTEQFGPCGVGWKYSVDRLWHEPGVGEERLAFAAISLMVRNGSDWSEPIPGVGGSAMVALESNGPRASDECYKMAITDALSVAMKMLGLASDIYMGLWDGSKYKDDPQPPTQKPESAKTIAAADFDGLTKDTQKDLMATATLIDTYIADGRDYDAYELYSGVELIEHKTALFGLLGKPQKDSIRASSKKANEAAPQ